MSFESFQFHPEIVAALKAQNFTTPTPIQAEAIPLVLQGKDLMGLAQTGTGKTAAFVLPILQRLSASPSKHVRALIVAPTRELAHQIHGVVCDFGKSLGISSVSVFGGVNHFRQVRSLQRGTDVVVACPGRLLDHMQQNSIDLSKLEVLVLDEADQMFDMGFAPIIRRIVQKLPRQRQTLLFSATMPEEIRRLAHEVLQNPTTVQVNSNSPTTTVTHAIFPVTTNLKSRLLVKLLKQTETESVLVFVRTKHRAKKLAFELGDLDFKVTSLQGNLSQGQRRAAMDGFRDGTYQIMVATDIAARGIDISSISHVINFDIPDTVEAYTHRIGRTGRAARTGDALTLVTPEDNQMVRSIERVLKKTLERRTLADFDYNSTAPAPKVRHSHMRNNPEGDQPGRPAHRAHAKSQGPRRFNDSRPEQGRHRRNRSGAGARGGQRHFGRSHGRRQEGPRSEAF